MMLHSRRRLTDTLLLASTGLLAIGLFACSTPAENPNPHGSTISARSRAALDALPEVESIATDKNGNVIAVSGRLGTDFDKVALVFDFPPNAKLVRGPAGQEGGGGDGGTTDGGTPEDIDEIEIGPCERTEQTVAGYDVEGGGCSTCRDLTGEIIGTACEPLSNPPPPTVIVSPEDATRIAETSRILTETTSRNDGLKYYVHSTRDDEGADESSFVYKVVVTGRDADPDSDTLDYEVEDAVFVDASSGDIVASHSQGVQPFFGRFIFDAQHRTFPLPGVRARFELDPVSPDAAVNRAFDYTGFTWQFYRTVFGRDSFNARGAAMVASVNVRFGDAMWNRFQTLFGDGDGITTSNMAFARDVVGHEWTHAVTQYTANLAYFRESGALNEAWSDIMGMTIKGWSGGPLNWRVAEEVVLPPRVAGRFMDNPTLDGRSRDNYRERYFGTADFGGVHINSGIANLAYKLVVTGGTHPRLGGVPPVTGQGIDRARRIFYRAYRYMNSASNFRRARIATRMAARDLYGLAAANDVDRAWDLVLVPR